LFKLCISTFDLWKLFVFVFEICKCIYFDLHEYEGLKDKLFSLLLCWTAEKKNNKEKIVDQSQKETNIYWKKSKKKEGSKKKKGEFNTTFITILFVVYWYLLAISLSLKVSVLSHLNLFGSPIIF